MDGKRAELPFAIARQPNLESMTVRNVEIFGRKPQDWSTGSFTFLANEANKGRSRSRLAELHVFSFDMDPRSVQWCLSGLGSLRILELRLPSSLEYASCGTATWIESLIPVANTLEHLIITGRLICNKVPKWDEFLELCVLRVDTDWFYYPNATTVGGVMGNRPGIDPSILLPPKIERLEINRVAGRAPFMEVLSILVRNKQFSRPRLSKLVLRHDRRTELPRSFMILCEAANIVLESMLVNRKSHFWENEENEFTRPA